MTAKRFRVNELVKYNYSEIGEYIDENHTDKPLRNDEVAELLNELHKENEQLKSENNILKITIARNEAYIERITHKGEWSNTSDEEKEVIAYLQAYHQGDVKEIRK